MYETTGNTDKHKIKKHFSVKGKALKMLPILFRILVLFCTVKPTRSHQDLPSRWCTALCTYNHSLRNGQNTTPPLRNMNTQITDQQKSQTTTDSCFTVWTHAQTPSLFLGKKRNKIGKKRLCPCRWIYIFMNSDVFQNWCLKMGSYDINKDIESEIGKFSWFKVVF